MNIRTTEECKLARNAFQKCMCGGQRHCGILMLSCY